MKNEKQSLVGTEWTGHCPYHNNEDMFLNRENRWECGSCNLQISSSGSGIKVCAQSGKGEPRPLVKKIIYARGVQLQQKGKSPTMSECP
jgi:hypothetical protein